jgi:hypothetical protein
MKTLHSCLKLLVLLSSICSLSIAESNSANAQIIKDRLQQNLPVRVNDSRIVQNSNATDLDREIVGKWVNSDSETKGITQVIITKSGDRYFIETFGKCHPTDCVWGKRLLKNIRRDANQIKALATYKDFAERKLKITAANGSIVLTNSTHFIDESRRPDYTSRDYFRKDDAVASDPAPSSERQPEPESSTAEMPTNSTLNIVGTWVNRNSKTPGITRIIIAKTGGRYFIQAFGKCHPTDCIWGERPLKNVQLNSRQATAIANYDVSFKKEMLRINASDGKITIVSSTHFIDGSGRPDYTSREYFRKDDDI